MQKSMHQNGFVFMKSVEPKMRTLDVAALLGQVVEAPGLTTVQELKPRNVSAATPNIYSGNFGYDSFPMHTDLAHWRVPPRYLLLRCVVGAQGVFTRLLDSSDVIEEVGSFCVRRCLVQPRRPIDGSRLLLRLFEEEGGNAVFRWDQLFLSPATKLSDGVYSSVRGAIEALPKTEIALLESGDMLLVDNWRILHGRSRVPSTGTGRIIHRVYLGDLRDGGSTS